MEIFKINISKIWTMKIVKRNQIRGDKCSWIIWSFFSTLFLRILIDLYSSVRIFFISSVQSAHKHVKGILYWCHLQIFTNLQLTFSQEGCQSVPHISQQMTWPSIALWGILYLCFPLSLIASLKVLFFLALFGKCVSSGIVTVLKLFNAS